MKYIYSSRLAKGKCRLVLFFVFCLFYTQENLAQFSTDLNQVTLPSVDNAALGSTGNVPVDLSTGRALINIPVYTIQDGHVQIPINLSYDASGVKVNQHPGWVGLNWNLSAGGSVTRVVKGKPDEWYSGMTVNTPSDGSNAFFYIAEPLGYFSGEAYLDASSWGTEAEIQNYIDDVMNKTLEEDAEGYRTYHLPDFEPDEYLFNVGGYSGKFLYGQDQKWHVVGDPSIKVENIFEQVGGAGIVPMNQRDNGQYQFYQPPGYPKYASGSVVWYFFGFKITVPNGTEYIFDTRSFNVNLMSHNEDDWRIDKWHLTKMVLPTGEEVDFEYTSRWTASFDKEFVIDKELDNPNSSWHISGLQGELDDWRFTGRITPERFLKKITTPNYVVDFSLSATNELTYDYGEIESVKVAMQERYLVTQNCSSSSTCSSNEELTSPMKYIEGDFTKLQWLKIDRIKVKNRSDEQQIIKDYKFTYNNDPNKRLMLMEFGEVGLPQHVFSYDDSKVLPGYLEAGGYEDHWGYYNGKSHASFLTNLTNDQADPSDYFGLRNPDEVYLRAGTLKTITYPTGGTTTFEYEPHYFEDYVQRGFYGGFFVSQGVLSNTGLGAPFSCSTIMDNCPCHDITDDCGCYPGCVAYDICNNEYQACISNPPTYIKYAGGLRIKKITQNPLSAPPTVKEYTYEGGLLAVMPKYYWPNYTDKEANNNTYSAERFLTRSSVPLSEGGSHVTYTKVTETIAGNGRTEYEFTGYAEGPNTNYIASVQDNAYLHSAYSTLAQRRGKPKVTTVFDQSNKVLRKEVNHYQQLSVAQAPDLVNAIRLNMRRVNQGSDWIFEGASYTVNIAPYRVVKKDVFQYGNGGSGEVSYSIDYGYDGTWALPTSEEFSNSDGKVHTTNYFYPINFNWSMDPFEAAAKDEMLTRHMIGIPLRTEKRVDNTLVSGTWSSFKLFTGIQPLPLPHKIYSYKDTWQEEVAINTYTTDGFPTEVVRRGWNPETYQWQDGLLTDKDFNSWHWHWDWNFTTNRQLQKYTDIDGQAVDYGYDAFQRLKTVTSRGGAVTTTNTYQYGSPNSVSSLTLFTDGTPSQSNLQTFDGLGRPLKTTVNGVVKNEIQYDNFGRTGKQTYLPGNFTTFEYEPSPLNRVLKEIYPDGNFTETIYGAEGNYYKQTTKDEDGKPTSVLTDILGRTYKTIDALGGETVNTYDDKNNLVKVVTPMGDDPLYNYTYIYNARNLLLQKTVPGTVGNYAYTYYPNDLLQSMTDPNGNAFTYEYDDYGRELFRKLGGTAIAESVYDVGGGINVGKLTQSVTHAVDNSTSFTMDYVYDPFGRVQSTSVNNHLNGSDLVVNDWNLADWLNSATRTHSINGGTAMSIVQGYEYDKFGRVKKSTYSVDGLSSILAENTWNDRDQLTRKILGGGLQNLDYTYNQRGWLTAINQPLGLFSGSLPMSDCDTPDNQTNGYEVFCGTNDASLEELNSLRFQENFLVECYDPCAATGGLIDTPPCNGSDPQAELTNVLANLETTYTTDVTITCEDGSTIIRTEPNTAAITYPAILYRVRLCDGTEAYMFADGLSLLTPGSYAIVQQLEVTGPDQTFYVNGGSGQGREITLDALLLLVVEGKDMTVGDYMQGNLPCEPMAPDCSDGEQQAQMNILGDIIGLAPNIDFSDPSFYPETLSRVMLCDGTEVYLFGFELNELVGSYLVLQEIAISSPADVLPIGTSVQNADLNDLFYLKLRYEEDDFFNFRFGNVDGQKNGNISGMKWQVAGREMQAYGFQYDALDRLKKARYGDIKGGFNYRLNDRYTVDNLGYDAIGNIQTLTRHGVLPDLPQPGCFDEGLIDVLTYAYDGNRLLNVTDAATAPFVDEGFKPGGAGNYVYDNNGNLKSDPNKGLNITYNYLNLPKDVIKSSGGVISFAYDASGRKYQKKVIGGADPYTKDYINGIEYKDGSLEAIYHEEGRVGKDANGNLGYEFTIRDHLGNSRVMFADLNGDGTIQLDDPDTPANESELLQENHYYPFGMNMQGGWTAQAGERNNYQYNGKELDEDLGLGWMHYGVRMYDPAVGRFTGVDPIADRFAFVSPFNYAENSPVSNIDLHGLQKISFHLLGRLNLNGNEFPVGATITIDAGNNNSAVFGVILKGIGTYLGSYSKENGFESGFVATNADYGDLAFEVEKPSGLVLPDWAVKKGLDIAKSELEPENLEEALSLSKEEVKFNYFIRSILTAIGNLVDQDVVTGIYDYDGSRGFARNENGEIYERKFTHVFKGKVNSFEFGEDGLLFNGQLVFSYTDQKCTNNCEEEENKKE